MAYVSANPSLFISAVVVIFGLLHGPVNSFPQHGTLKSKALRSRFHPNFLSTPISFGIGAARKQEAVLDWSFLDGVYLITCPNGDADGQRIKKTKEVLRNVGLLDLLEVKEFDTDDEDRVRGCYTSHVSVMCDILAASNLLPRKSPAETLFRIFGDATKSTTKDSTVLILEDNVALSGRLDQLTIDAVANYAKDRTRWDMIHLAYTPYVPNLEVTKTDSDRIVKLSCGIGSALGTTAYVINTEGMKRIIEEDEQNGFYAPIPDVMAKLFPESRYAINPTIFVRAANTKSLVNPQLDDLRQLLFRPAITSFTQSLLVLSGLSTNALLPLVIMLLLFGSLCSAKLTFDSALSLATTGTFDGPILLPIASSLFTIFSLAVIAQGVLLAPKPTASLNDSSN